MTSADDRWITRAPADWDDELAYLEHEAREQGEADAAQEEDTECLTCDGRGGTLSYDSDGDGAWAMTTTNLDICPDCLGQNKCPGCGKQYDGIDLNTFNCACGWAYDEDRFNPSEDFYTEGY